MTPPANESYFAAAGSDPEQRPWSWRCLDASGAEVSHPTASQGFPTQADAESWIGEAWRELLDDGVEQVMLLEGGREVYGPMSLRA